MGCRLLEQALAYCGDDITDNAVRELLGVVPEDALHELVEAIAEQSAERALGLVHRFQKEGQNLQHFCREAIRHMRNLLMARVCGAESDLIAATPDQRPGLAKAAALFSEEDLTRYFQILLHTDDDLRRKPDPRVHLEMGLLRLVNAARLGPVEELLADARGGGSGTAGGSGSGSGTKGTAAAPSFPSRRLRRRLVQHRIILVKRLILRKKQRQPVQRPATTFRKQVRRQTEVRNAPAVATQPFVAGVSGGGSATAVAPALAPVQYSGITSSAPTSTPPSASKKEVVAEGLSLAEVTEIKTAIQAQQKFIGEFLEYASRWALEGMELRICFPADKSAFAGLIEVRETLEKIRNAAGKVLQRPVRVCARLDSSAAIEGKSSSVVESAEELRAKFEKDPMVKSMLQRFGGKISGVRRQEE